MRTEEARNAARIKRGKIAAGEVGPGKRESVKVETSLAEYVAHLERKSAAKGKPATWANNVRHLVKKHISATVGPMEPRRCGDASRRCRRLAPRRDRG